MRKHLIEAIEKTLVISPHPDDAEIGAGCFISSKKNIVHAVLSHCDEDLRGFPSGTNIQEWKKANEGVDKRMMFFPVRHFEYNRQEILDYLISIKQEIQPSLVLCPCRGDKHQDHKVVTDEVIRAFHNSTILGYEIPKNTQDCTFNYYYPITTEQLINKKRLINLYESQKNISGRITTEHIEALAIVRGLQCGSRYAEAFETIKIINNGM